ncbi:MAG: UbiA family prenyltransferase [Gemmataceae bacterium]
MRFLPLARLLRLPNVFTAMADILLATLGVIAWHVRAEDAAPLGGVFWLRFLCILLASSCFYSSGMVWNDYFDIEQDRKERGYRPLPAGEISLGAARRLGAMLMLAGLALCLLADWGPDGFRLHSVILGLLLIGAILLYDGPLKKTSVAPIVMGLCRSLNVLLGLSVAGQVPFLWGWALAFVVGLYITGVTWFARREAAVSSPAQLVLGASLMLAALVIALMLPTLAQETDPSFMPSPFFPYLLVAFGFYLALAIFPALQRPQPRLVQAAVKRSILGLILFDAILAGAVTWLPGVPILLLYIPSYFLGRWVYST